MKSLGLISCLIVSAILIHDVISFSILLNIPKSKMIEIILFANYFVMELMSIGLWWMRTISSTWKISRYPYICESDMEISKYINDYIRYTIIVNNIRLVFSFIYIFLFLSYYNDMLWFPIISGIESLTVIIWFLYARQNHLFVTNINYQ